MRSVPFERRIATRLAELLGKPIPDDPGVAREALEGLLRQLQASRVVAERQASASRGLAAALPMVEHDIVLRTSPELRELRNRAEALRHQVWAARLRADQIVWNLGHWQRSVQEREDEQSTTADTDCGPETGLDLASLPGVARMQSMLDEFALVRGHTDRIGHSESMREADGER